MLLLAVLLSSRSMGLILLHSDGSRAQALLWEVLVEGLGVNGSTGVILVRLSRNSSNIEWLLLLSCWAIVQLLRLLFKGASLCLLLWMTAQGPKFCAHLAVMGTTPASSAMAEGFSEGTTPEHATASQQLASMVVYISHYCTVFSGQQAGMQQQAHIGWRLCHLTDGIAQ
jgi:hypothetical protein